MRDSPFADLIPNTPATAAPPINNATDNPFNDLIPNTSPKPKFTPSTLDRAIIGAVAAKEGFVQGLKDIGQGAKQLYLEGAEKVGLEPPGTADAYTQQTDQARAAFDKLAQLEPVATGVGRFAGNAAPYVLAPEVKGATLAAKIAKNAAIGAGIGGTQYVPEGGSRAFNTAIGGVAGGVIPPVVSGITAANPYIKAGTGAAIGAGIGYLNGESGLTDVGLSGLAGAGAAFVPGLAGNAIKGALNKIPGVAIQNGAQPLEDVAALNILKGIDQQKALDTKAAADRLGINLTPAEASGNPVVASRQGKLGTSEIGQQLQANFYNQRLPQEQAAVKDLLNTISPTDQNAAADVRQAANNVVSSQMKELSNKATPLYNQAYKEKIDPDQLKNLMNSDGTIENAVNNVLSNPAFKYELQGYAPNSIKVLDLAKKNIDAQIASANGTVMQPGNQNLARVLNDSKNRLVSAIDEFSPTYAKARQIYAEGSPTIQALRDSPLGKIGSMDDTQLKNLSKVIFDPSQTDPQVITKLRDQISAKNPDAWNQIVKNEMDRRLNVISNLDTPGSYSGSQFYNNILRSDRDFNQFLIATQKIPGATQKLMDMRKVFKNLINQPTVKTAAGLSKSSLDVPRSTAQYLTNLVTGKYDQAAIKLITGNTWDKQFNRINKIKDQSLKISKTSELLGRIAAAQGAQFTGGNS